MALGKAALPKRFAEWLRDQLLDRFGIVSEVIKNERPDYDGYGLNILRAESKESNLNQDREYYWKYEEDSGYSNTLEELDLPETVNVGGKIMRRPHYKFGRVYLTSNDRRHITERISATINGVEYSSGELDRIRQFYDSGKLDINSFGKEPITDKNKTPIPNEYAS
jgi:hypothetical protein